MEFDIDSSCCSVRTILTYESITTVEVFLSALTQFSLNIYFKENAYSLSFSSLSPLSLSLCVRPHRSHLSLSLIHSLCFHLSSKHTYTQTNKQTHDQTDKHKHTLSLLFLLSPLSPLLISLSHDPYLPFSL